MKTILLLFTILLSVSYGCTKKENPLLIKTKQFDFKADENCIRNCSYVHLEIPIASGNPSVSTNINNHVLNFFKNTIAIGKVNDSLTYQDLGERFIFQYKEVNRTYPEEAIAWEANFKVNHQSLSSKVYQIVWDYYLFTGGAHGLQAKKVMLFDTSTGNLVKTNDLFINHNGFVKLAEQKFRKKYKITSNLNEAGFTFDKDVFKLPENFYQTSTHWVLHYNPYEIAPYVKGSSIIKIPRNEIAPFLNPLYFSE